jgi:hypothetical protein
VEVAGLVAVVTLVGALSGGALVTAGVDEAETVAPESTFDPAPG